MHKKTEVKCSGTMLTAGFHAASPPLIWRFDLERNHSFTIALQGEEGDWDLGMTSSRGEFHSVVHFIAREDAEEAFAKIETALAKKYSALGYIGKALLIVLVLAIIIFFAIGLVVHHVNRSAGDAASQIPTLYGMQVPNMPSMPGMSSYMQTAPTVKQNGVPQSADDVLSAPQ